MRDVLPRLISTLLICSACLASDVREDTARLLEHLGRLRGYADYEMDAGEYKAIQDEYLAWIDSRLRAGEGGSAMNEELKAAGLLSDGPETVEDEFDKTYAGFLGGVNTEPRKDAPDLLTVTFGIHTGGYCNYDETIVLYSRQPLRQLARVNAEQSYSHGYHLRQLAVGKDDAGRGRIIGSEWVASNCTSNWNGNVFRIDLLRAGAIEKVLNRGVVAFFSDPVNINIEGDTVTLTYSTITGETADLVRPGVARYRVQDRRAILQAPIAASYGGFIDEWMDLDDADAARWSTPEAASKHHDLHAMANPELFEWAHVAECPGSPPTREIGIRWNESKRITYFLISGSNAADMKMLSIPDQPSPGCTEIDIRKDRSSITAEPQR